MPGTELNAQVCALDEAMNALARIDPRRAQVIELRFFGGLTVEETGQVLQLSAQTVMRDWRLARAWLARELSQPSNSESVSDPPRLDRRSRVRCRQDRGR